MSRSKWRKFYFVSLVQIEFKTKTGSINLAIAGILKDALGLDGAVVIEKNMATFHTSQCPDVFHFEISIHRKIDHLFTENPEFEIKIK